MQLKTKSAAASLAAATAALLGQSATTDAVAQELMPWEFDSAILYYGESDSRVRDFSVNVLARKEVREEGFLDINLAYDSLTGASPSGAVPTRVVHTFTSPSGGGTYSVAAGELPLDSSFLDTRVAVSANYEWPLTRLTQFNVGASLSDEYDYTHTGVNMKLARDFNNRNTTLSFGLARANDTVDPVGGTPVALTLTSAEADSGGLTKLGSQTKNVDDLLLGVTQVVSRRTIVQFNYGLSRSNGYLNDPYKILSIVDPVLGDPIPAPEDASVDYLYLYEGRPDTREKQSLYSLLKRDVDGDVFDVSYRYMTDDWDVTSHTIDVHFRRNIGGGRFVQPHLRLYSQTAASFYRTELFYGAPLPTYATADYRLSELTSVTVGLKFGAPTRSGEMSGRIELYHQNGKPSPGSQVGSLRNLDLNPGFYAVIAQLSYKFGG
jgi:hypothetical protein